MYSQACRRFSLPSSIRRFAWERGGSFARCTRNQRIRFPCEPQQSSWQLLIPVGIPTLKHPFLELQGIEIARYRSGLIPGGWVQRKLESIGLASRSSIKPLKKKTHLSPSGIQIVINHPSSPRPPTPRAQTPARHHIHPVAQYGQG